MSLDARLQVLAAAVTYDADELPQLLDQFYSPMYLQTQNRVPKIRTTKVLDAYFNSLSGAELKIVKSFLASAVARCRTDMRFITAMSKHSDKGVSILTSNGKRTILSITNTMFNAGIMLKIVSTLLRSKTPKAVKQRAKSRANRRKVSKRKKA